MLHAGKSVNELLEPGLKNYVYSSSINFSDLGSSLMLVYELKFEIDNSFIYSSGIIFILYSL